MSFQEDVRAEMIAHLGERACCDRAALGMAILATGGVSFTGSGGVRLAVQSSRAAVVRRFFELAKARYGVLGELRAAKTERLSRATRYELRFDAKDMLEPLGLKDPDSLLGVRRQPALENECCACAALRAAFLLTGYAADPHSEYRLEFSLREQTMADFVGNLLKSASFPAKGVGRRGQFVVYLNGMDAVGDALTFLGAPGAMLKLQSTGAVKNLSNAIHRQLNCDASNIVRALNASEKQVRAIEAIQNAVGLATLTPPLMELAQARLDNPNAPLSELGALLDPPLGKSSVNSRMRRLMDIAEKLGGEGEHA